MNEEAKPLDSVTIPKIRIKIDLGGERVMDRDLALDVHFTDESLGEAMTKQASLYAYYALKQAEAETLVDYYKHETEKALANACDMARVRLISEGMTKPTDKQIESAAKNDADFVEYSDKLLEAQCAVRTLKVATRALEHRREMISGRAFMHREELKQLGTSAGMSLPTVNRLPMPSDK